MSSSKVLHRGLPVPYIGGSSLLLCNVVKFYACQYVVFKLKLILSYLLVRLT